MRWKCTLIDQMLYVHLAIAPAPASTPVLARTHSCTRQLPGCLVIVQAWAVRTAALQTCGPAPTGTGRTAAAAHLPVTSALTSVTLTGPQPDGRPADVLASVMMQQQFATAMGRTMAGFRRQRAHQQARQQFSLAGCCMATVNGCAAMTRVSPCDGGHRMLA